MNKTPLEMTNMTYDSYNIFAKILRGEIPCEKLYEDEHTLAFMDIMPQADGHVLVLPKESAAELFDLSDEAASAAIRSNLHDPSTPVLVVSGFTESRTLDALRDPRYAEVLYAPIVRYPIQGKLVRLPLAIDNHVYSYLENIVTHELANHPRFLVMGIDSFATREYVSWLQGRLSTAGFTPRRLGEYGGIQLTAFESRRE